jgi:predicted NBD/HSP70 family sugar kinase
MRLQSDKLLTKRIDPLVMKSLNAIELLELIRAHCPISRAHLAARSGLSKPTVSGQVDALISRSLVIEVGPGDTGSRGGKKPTLLEFNGSYGQILCADIGPEWIRLAVADLCGTVLCQDQLPTRPERGVRPLIATIKKGFTRLLAALPEAELRVMSVAVPGIVDVREGVVLETDNVFGWRDLRLGAELAGYFGIPVHIDNDVNLAALAELSTGRVPDDFVLVRLDTGIGAAVVFGGRLYHGAHSAAGEVGHMLLHLGALEKAVDPRGYLESVVGQDRVRERARRLARTRGRAAAEQEIDNEVATHLGAAISNIILAYDPHTVILLGDAFVPFIERIRNITRKIVPWEVEIRCSGLGDDAALRGALAAGLNHAYDQIARSLRIHAPGPMSLAAAEA